MYGPIPRYIAAGHTKWLPRQHDHTIPGINLPALAQKAMKEDLYFSNGLIHGASPKISNGTRLGFASSTAPELERCVEILADLLKK